MKFIDGDPCPVCDTPTKRHPLSDVFHCENYHAISKGPQEKPNRFELREANYLELNTYDQAEVMRENGGLFSVWDLLTDEPFYDKISDEYAYLINEGRARSLESRLNGI